MDWKSLGSTVGHLLHPYHKPLVKECSNANKGTLPGARWRRPLEHGFNESTGHDRTSVICLCEEKRVQYVPSRLPTNALPC